MHYNVKQEENFHLHSKRRYAGDLRAPIIKKIFKKYILGNSKVLDIGAGSGALVNIIPGSIGVDLVPKNDKIIRASSDNLPFDNNFFDVVFATEILEHLDDQILVDSVVEVNRVLVNGGFFIITVPYREDLLKNIISCPFCNKDFHRVLHCQYFDEDKITKLLELRGFTIEKIKLTHLDFISKHRFIGLFYRVLGWFGVIDFPNLMVVAKKYKNL